MKSKPIPPPRVPPFRDDVLDERDEFDAEPPTKQKNVTASVYQSLLSVFDEMTAEQRMEFVEFAARFSTLDAQGRHALIELLPAYATLDEPDREALYDRATELAAARWTQRNRDR